MLFMFNNAGRPVIREGDNRRYNIFIFYTRRFAPAARDGRPVFFIHCFSYPAYSSL